MLSFFNTHYSFTLQNIQINLMDATRTPHMFNEFIQAIHTLPSWHIKSNIDGFYPGVARGFLWRWINGFLYNGVSDCRSSESADACSKPHSWRSMCTASWDCYFVSQVGKLDFTLVFANSIQSARLSAVKMPEQKDKMLLFEGDIFCSLSGYTRSPLE